MHISRIAEELIIWNSDAFNLIQLSDKVVTGSSIMPQKKNPDLLEYLRGKSGSTFGNLFSMLTILKGLPLSYFKDLQDDKELVFNSYDQIKNSIQNYIDNNDVCLFMKGTPDAPQCGFSMAVSNMLKILEVNFKGINVLEDQSMREGIKVFSDWPTIPQLYVKKEFIGGCDIVKEMYENGELKKVFDDKGVNYKK